MMFAATIVIITLGVLLALAGASFFVMSLLVARAARELDEDTRESNREAKRA